MCRRKLTHLKGKKSCKWFVSLGITIVCLKAVLTIHRRCWQRLNSCKRRYTLIIQWFSHSVRLTFRKISCGKMDERKDKKTFVFKEERQHRLASSTSFGRNVLMTFKRGCNSRLRLPGLFPLRWQKTCVENLPAGLSKIADYNFKERYYFIVIYVNWTCLFKNPRAHAGLVQILSIDICNASAERRSQNFSFFIYLKIAGQCTFQTLMNYFH